MADDRLRSALKLAAHDLRVSDDWPENLAPADVLDKYLVDPTVRKIDRLEAIVAGYAEQGPVIVDDGVCRNCEAVGSESRPRDTENPASHLPECLWRQSKEMYPNGLAVDEDDDG